MNTDTPPQPAHGESLTFSEVFGLPAGSFVKHLKESEASGISPEERSMMPAAEPWEFQEWNSGVNNTIGYGIITHDRDICITVHARRPKGDGINDVNCHEQAQETAKRLVAEHNLLASHPDLSAVEAHSKETMDEVRKLLGEYLQRSKGVSLATETARIKYSLAKLNPPL